MLGEDQRHTLLGQLSLYLGEQRVKHSANVEAAAIGLAQVFAPELAAAAQLAGLLHDNAKRLSAEELIRLARQHDIEITPVEAQLPQLLHGKVGAALLAERFGVDDARVAEAVAWHVTGHPNMSLLGRILFVADQIAADRDFPGIAELRAVAQKDLSLAVFMVAQLKLTYAVQRQRPLEPLTVAVYNEFRPRGA
jgi:predicted HD superfamily hydrolase involved in NAD metabolism